MPFFPLFVVEYGKGGDFMARVNQGIFKELRNEFKEIQEKFKEYQKTYTDHGEVGDYVGENFEIFFEINDIWKLSMDLDKRFEDMLDGFKFESEKTVSDYKEMKDELTFMCGELELNFRDIRSRCVSFFSPTQSEQISKLEIRNRIKF